MATELAWAERTSADDTHREITIDPGLELAIAMYDVLLRECGPEFAHAVRHAFEARASRRLQQGGAEAAASRMVLDTFEEFDWHREIVRHPA